FARNTGLPHFMTQAWLTGRFEPSATRVAMHLDRQPNHLFGPFPRNRHPLRLLWPTVALLLFSVVKQQ
ncbi:MAG TPA: hypothetical protein VFN42_04775, partial [Acetobacteraceae bacterium]|nr:hypothetical protein [Acetobacteraceae bacterium]